LNLSKLLIRGELFEGRAGWDCESVPALITELAAKWIHLSTFCAGNFQSTAAFVAEFGTLWILTLALWAFHL